jgi:hypothetical protein
MADFGGALDCVLTHVVTNMASMASMASMDSGPLRLGWVPCQLGFRQNTLPPLNSAWRARRPRTILWPSPQTSGATRLQMRGSSYRSPVLSRRSCDPTQRLDISPHNYRDCS